MKPQKYVQGEALSFGKLKELPNETMIWLAGPTQSWKFYRKP